MHRDLRRSPHSQFAILLLLVAALATCAGCGFTYPPPTVPEAVKKEMFHVGEPIALLTFEPGRGSGRIIGEVHDWPIPHPGGGEGIPRNFTYLGQFTVTTKSDEDGMPAGAEGTRKVYFHENMAQLNFTDAKAYASGEEVALDTISMSFSFKQNHKLVGVRMIARQKSAQAFSYKGRKIDPPADRDSADTLQGEYSADLGGYLLHSLNE